MRRNFSLAKHVHCQTIYLGKKPYNRNPIYTCFEKQCGQITTQEAYFSQIMLCMSTNVFKFQGTYQKNKNVIWLCTNLQTGNEPPKNG